MIWTTRHRRRSSSSIAIIGKGGTIALPPNFDVFRLGQRVYFHVQGQSVVVTKHPKRVHNGRLPSSRIKKAIRNLATYGPRAGNQRIIGR